VIATQLQNQGLGSFFSAILDAILYRKTQRLTKRAEALHAFGLAIRQVVDSLEAMRRLLEICDQSDKRISAECASEARRLLKMIQDLDLSKDDERTEVQRGHPGLPDPERSERQDCQKLLTPFSHSIRLAAGRSIVISIIPEPPVPVTVSFCTKDGITQISISA
jgi:hypothetical protein